MSSRSGRSLGSGRSTDSYYTPRDTPRSSRPYSARSTPRPTPRPVSARTARAPRVAPIRSAGVNDGGKLSEHFVEGLRVKKLGEDLAERKESVSNEMEVQPPYTIVRPDPTEHRTSNNNSVTNYYVGKRRIFCTLPVRYLEMGMTKGLPQQRLKMDFIFGFNGRACRNNLAYTADNKVVYAIAAVGVKLDPATNTQTHFIGHNEDISAFAIHPDKEIVATGQRDPKGAGTPFVVVWNSRTLEQLARITWHERAVTGLAFSGDGKFLVSVGEDDSHMAAVWDWARKTRKPLLEGMTNKAAVYGVVGGPVSSESMFQFVTVGVKHLKYHTVNKNEKGKLVLTSSIVAGANSAGNEKSFNCACFISEKCFVAGGASGKVFQCQTTGLGRVFQAFDKAAVGSLCPMPDGSGYIAGSTLGQLKIFSSKHALLQTIQLPGNAQVDRPGLSIRSMDSSKATGAVRVVVGTRTQIFQVDVESEKMALLTSGFSDEIWALATHPSQDTFVVGADDGSLMYWSYAGGKKKIMWRHLLPQHTPRSAAFNFDGSKIVIGCKDGFALLVETDTGLIELQKKFSKEQIEAVAFHPNGRQVALGGYNQEITLYWIKSGNQKHLRGHTSSVIKVDYSADGNFLMSNSRDYEVLYWESKTGRRIGQVPSWSWRDWSCVLGWPLQGIWQGMDGTDVNCVAVSGGDEIDFQDGSRVIATGDDYGNVSLYKYPSTDQFAPLVRFAGHSAHVTQVRFTRGNKYLISTGGGDTATIQWRVLRRGDKSYEPTPVPSRRESISDENFSFGKIKIQEEEQQKNAMAAALLKEKEAEEKKQAEEENKKKKEEEKKQLSDAIRKDKNKAAKPDEKKDADKATAEKEAKEKEEKKEKEAQEEKEKKEKEEQEKKAKEEKEKKEKEEQAQREKEEREKKEQQEKEKKAKEEKEAAKKEEPEPDISMSADDDESEDIEL